MKNRKRSFGRHKRCSRKTVNAAPKTETGTHVNVRYTTPVHVQLTAMADEKFPTVLVRWEGNNSKRYDNTKEIFVSNIVASNKTAVIEPSINQISVGDHIEYEFVAKKGKVQLWHGVVVFTDPDAERRTGSVPNEPETTSKRARCRRTTTKEASYLNATDSDTAERRTAATSLFENLSSTKGKRQKRHSSSPLPGAEPKRKRGRCATVCSRV